MASDGTYDLIYFLAYRSGPEDFEYIVGPASLNEFSSNPTKFQERADASEELLAPGKLIYKYTSWANLDEAALGKYLMKRAARRQPRFQMYVISVIEALDDGDRDDVAVGFFESASDKQLVSFIGSETGRRVVDRLYDELVGQGGYVGGDEEKQGKRDVHARGERKSVGSGKGVPVRVDRGGRRDSQK